LSSLFSVFKSMNAFGCFSPECTFECATLWEAEGATLWEAEEEAEGVSEGGALSRGELGVDMANDWRILGRVHKR
jgi:hypothetical protein